MLWHVSWRSFVGRARRRAHISLAYALRVEPVEACQAVQPLVLKVDVVLARLVQPRRDRPAAGGKRFCLLMFFIQAPASQAAVAHGRLSIPCRHLGLKLWLV